VKFFVSELRKAQANGSIKPFGEEDGEQGNVYI